MLVHGLAQLVHTVGPAFAYWLFAQSMFVVGALRRWCLVVTISTTLAFTTLPHANIVEDNLYFPRGLQRRARAAVDAELDVLAVTTWLVPLATAIVARDGADLLGTSEWPPAR